MPGGGGDGPTTSGPSTTSSVAGGTIETMKDTFIPVFNNKVSDYREWRQRIMLYKKKLSLQGKEKEAILNLLTSLHGTAWKQVEHMVEAVSEASDGFDRVLKTLDVAFQYDSRVEMPRALEKYFYQLSRKSDQTLLSYCTEHREQLREIEKHGVRIPDSVSGWMLLRRSNLTQEQKHLVQSQVGATMEATKVEEAMYYLYGQDFKTKADGQPRWNKNLTKKGPRWYPRKHQQGYTAEEYDPEFVEDYEDAYALDEEFLEDEQAPDYDDDPENAYGVFEDEAYYQEEPWPEDPDPQLEEAYATYLDARRQFANLKAARGYYPVVALTTPTDLPGASSSSTLQQRPVTKGSKGKKGKSKGKSPPQKGGALQRGRTALETMQCFKCGRYGHAAADCPMNKGSQSPKRAKTEGSPKGSGQAYMMHDLQQKSTTMLSEQGWYGLQDGGASSMVCGHETLMHIIEFMHNKGVPVERYTFHPTTKLFGFGGDATRKADWTVRLPVYVNGASGLIECFLVDGATPLLIGRPILKALKVKVDWDKDLICYGDTAWQPAVRGERGEYLLRLDDGVEQDPMGVNVFFDLVTTETYEMVQRTGVMHSSTYTLLQYLEATGRELPEHCLQAEDENVTDEEPTDGRPLAFQDEEETAAVRKAITDKLLRGIRFHHATMFAHRRTVLEQGLRAHEQGAKVFWEVYSGEAGLSMEMQRRGYVVFSFDLNTGWDFDMPEHRNSYYKLLEDIAPDFVWVAPACKKWSKMQALNMLTPEQTFALKCERDYEEAVHLKLAERTFAIQYNEGRDAGIEHPAWSKAWETVTWSNLPGWPCRLDQCAYETKIADQYIKKPTRLQLTSPSMVDMLAWKCPGDHEHLQLEGSLPGIGSLTKAAGAYQETFCYWIGEAIDLLYYEPEEIAMNGDDDFGDEEYTPTIADHHRDDEPNANSAQTTPRGNDPSRDGPRGGQRTQTGVLQRLQSPDSQQAKRTISRLHRNLGHPTNAELCRLLTMKGAHDTLIHHAQNHDCPVCTQHQRRPQAPVSSVPNAQEFNTRVQADTLWIKVSKSARAQPVMMISDTATRFLGGRVLLRESPEEFVLAMERGWIRTFGPMKTLQVDDHRSWSSDYVKSWCSENGIQLQISPGQSHTRLAILERRHKVSRRAIELYLADQLQGDVLQPHEPRERLIQALCYVIPQINRGTNVRGYSPVQWVLGYTPHVPGLLTEEPLSLSSLDPSDEFLQKLQRQKKAANAVFAADVDTRLRRALSRKFTGHLTIFQLGDLCYYYRDGPGGTGPKLRWRGPARIVMVEQLDSGPQTTIYWVVHGTNLLRAAPEHLRPVPPADGPKGHDDDPFYRAQQALQGVRSRGTTQYTDLTRTNKRQRHEVSSADEDEEFDDEDLPDGDDDHPGLRDSWQVSDDRKTWTRIHNVPRKELYVPEMDAEVPSDRFTSDRLTTVRRPLPHPARVRLRDDWRVMDASRSLHYTWTGTTTFEIDDQKDDDSDVLVELFGPDEPQQPDEPSGEPPPSEEPPPPEGNGQGGGTATISDSAPAGGAGSTEPVDSSPLQEASPVPVPEHQRQLYEPSPSENFQAQRARVDKQETLSFLNKPIPYGPIRSETARSSPYDHEVSEDLNFQIDIDVEKMSELPPGWHVEKGWLCLDAPTDEWSLEGNWLIRNHYIPRKRGYRPTEEECPIDLNYLAKDRVTHTSHGTFKDRWKRHSINPLIEEAFWTGQTKFKLKPNWRTKAQDDYKKASGGYKTMRKEGDQQMTKKKKGKDEVYERHMSVADRQAFMKAKIKELESFFKNEVWLYDHEKNADPSRILKAHFILTWKKNEDGSPRAKARLITQGFKDPDALSGALSTNAPTLTRLARGMILSICQLNAWKMFTSDITTAFLQGKNFAEGSDRVIWIRLPKDAKELLGLEADAPQLMKLVKPMYGLCDAPRAWYEEASERILKVGEGNIQRHPLDPCLFMVYHPLPEGQNLDPNVERELACVFGIHVDDLVGCGDPSDPYFIQIKEKLQNVFTFREWQDGDKLEYCGSQINCEKGDVIILGQEEYIHKVKPIPIIKERTSHPDTDVTEKERSLLRGLIGGLQWPATQTAPHLQVGISQLAGRRNFEGDNSNAAEGKQASSLRQGVCRRGTSLQTLGRKERHDIHCLQRCLFRYEA